MNTEYIRTGWEQGDRGDNSGLPDGEIELDPTVTVTVF